LDNCKKENKTRIEKQKNERKNHTENKGYFENINTDGNPIIELGVVERQYAVIYLRVLIFTQEKKRLHV